MRQLRVAVLILFVAALAANLGTSIWQKQKEDHTKPTIESSVDVLQASVNDGEEVLLSELTATDAKDGDITDMIMVSGKSYFIEKGTANIKYVVFDSDNNVCQFERQVTYQDYQSPEFSIAEKLVYPRNSEAHVLDYVTAKDMLDGDITDRIRMTENNIDSKEPGIYPVKLEVVNSYGDRSEIQVNVEIKNPGDTAEVNLTNYLVYLNQGAQFDPIAYVDEVVTASREELTLESKGDAWILKGEDGKKVAELVIEGAVDTNTPGCYQISYSYSTQNSSASASLTVVVRE